MATWPSGSCSAKWTIDGEAGPTEVVVVADKTATPAWVAADLLSQAEHEELRHAPCW